MKKRLVFLLSMGWMLGAVAHDGTVNITGIIQNVTCSVAQDSTNKEVSLGNIASNQLMEVGDVSPPVEFTLDLQNCSSVTKDVALTFSGTTDGTNPDLLALSGEAGAASGVGIAIKDDQSTLIPIGSLSREYAIDPSQTDNLLVFYAQYMVTSAGVTAGTANGTATFSLTYQ